MSEHKPQRRVHLGYQGKENPSERERIMHLLDVYRSTEGFVAGYLPRWMAVSTHEGLKGGLLTIHQREASHARTLETRLRALGRVPQATVPGGAAGERTGFFRVAGNKRRGGIAGARRTVGTRTLSSNPLRT